MKKQKIKNKRKIYMAGLVLFFWGMFPTAYQMAMHQRGKFAIGGEYCLLIRPFVIAEIVFTLADLVREADRWRIEE